MNMAFACAKEDEQGPETTHETATVMKRCQRCRKQAVAGYWCMEDGCRHEDTDPEDQLAGHGEGRCELVEEDLPHQPLPEVPC